MHDIFLSYSRKDENLMQQIKQQFVGAGLSVWTDEGIEPDTRSWKRAIQKAILNTASVACVLSPDAAESRWVQEELDFAELHDKPIFLIMARGDEKSSIPFGFAAHQWVDIRETDNYDSQMSHLIECIEIRIAADFKEKTRPPIERKPTTKPYRRSSSPLTTQAVLEAVQTLLLPPFDWCYIPEGDVVLEDGGYVPKIGQKQQVHAFHIAKYPLTNAQFAPFIEYGGYDNPLYWTDAGWKHKEKEAWTKPRFWRDRRFMGDDRPVVGVSWYEAMAYCNWLNARIELTDQISLPTEQQWQRAAQGNDQRVFSWGNEWDAQRCNHSTEDYRSTQTNRVTYYQSGASPFGVMDMCGNIEEWCLTEYYTGSDNPEDAVAQSPDQQHIWRCLRGGAWYDLVTGSFRVAFRDFDNPYYGLSGGGFRIVYPFG
jgi:formylglycine-generating enzyme required for sulfatase activity